MECSNPKKENDLKKLRKIIKENIDSFSKKKLSWDVNGKNILKDSKNELTYEDRKELKCLLAEEMPENLRKKVNNI